MAILRQSNHLFSVAQRDKRSLNWGELQERLPVQKEEGAAEWIRLPCPKSSASPSW